MGKRGNPFPFLSALQRGFSKGFSMLSTSAHVYSEIYLHLNVGALWAAVLGREGNLGILRHAAFRQRRDRIVKYQTPPSGGDFLPPASAGGEKGQSLSIPQRASARFLERL
jgi:hypothetical protein